jgi:putative FmdB family regulatory protein
MPLYDYKCSNCGMVENVWAKINEQEKLCACGLWMKRVISATRSTPDLQPYLDPNMGHEPVYVESRQHRKRLMKERGLAESPRLSIREI